MEKKMETTIIYLGLGVRDVGMEGQGDLVSRLIMGISGVTVWVIGVYQPTY